MRKWGLAPLVLAVCGVSVRGAALPKDYLAAHQVKRGMRGYGLSVFRGTRPQRFEVEVIGVLRNAFPKQDIILARMSGAGLEKTGIIAGMSGSPVYLKVGDAFKLAGAIAYGWSFPKEPLCGITPAENMFGVFQASRSEPKAKGGLPPPGGVLDAPLSVAERAFSEIRVALSAPQWDKMPGGEAQLYRLRTPLALGGLSPPAFALARQKFEALGFMPLQGAAGAAPANAPRNLLPGSALAIVLAEGDLDLSGSGTVTDVRGDTILAFGHPMLGEGRVQIPIASAIVHYCYPSMMRSFKLTSPGPILGTLTTDMQAAVVGKLGRMPTMIPVEARLRRADSPGEEVYHCRVLDHPRLTPSVIQTFLLNSLLVRGDFPRENTLRYKATVELAGRKPLVYSNVYSGFTSYQGLFAALSDIVSPVMVLGNNQFGKVAVRRLTASFEVEAKATAARVESVRLERNDYAPGETLKAIVTLRPAKKEPVVVRLGLHLPKDVPEGTTTVTVCDSATNAQLDHSEAPHKQRPDNLDQLLTQLREQEPSGRIYLRVKLPDRGVAYRGVELPSLPDSILQVVGSAKTTGLVLTGKSLVSHAETPYVVKGHHRLQVLIRQR